MPELEKTRRELQQIRRMLERTQREVTELKAATDAALAPPPLKGRPGRLDDLREQLRAAHREASEESEE
jgi:hypothetical protein